jgi:hypothetical protein
MAAIPNTKLEKTPGTLFMGRTMVKNTIIMRHLFTRMRECFGPYDGMRGGHNYNRKGVPRKIPGGGPESLWDVHVVKWQHELVIEQLIEPKEILSVGSIMMIINWVLTTQPLNATWKIGSAAKYRAAAVQAGWLLTMDLIKLEEMNYKDVTVLDAVTEDPDEEAEPDV